MVYISIESRKGGVGKTTTALTLADTLLDKNYQVLLIDMDMVGTTLDSTFISANSGYIHEVKFNGTPVNLVFLFKKLYMAGKNVPAFALEDEQKKMSFSFVLGKCNFIGSNIYENLSGERDYKPLEDPRILYDAFHAYWLLEFVKKISVSFENAVGKENKVAIILDNSPGFSSVENSIHDYLTDLGPEMGKILLVTTIDPQDLGACRQSKVMIEELFNDKVAAGKYYRSLADPDTRKEEKKKSPAFESVWNALCMSNGQQPKYHADGHVSTSAFVSVLVNKVPSNLAEQLYAGGYLKREKNEEAALFQNHLLYYFSNPKLTDDHITFQKSYMDNVSGYIQSGKIGEINADDEKYRKFCQFSRQLGLGNFLKEEWAPLARFRDIIEILTNKEIISETPTMLVNTLEHGIKDGVDRLNSEVNIVKDFVLANVHNSDDVLALLQDIGDFVISRLNNVEERSEIVFHPDRPKLVKEEDFVTSFGLAVYRLHIYESICDMFNKLMECYSEDADNVEKMDKYELSTWIENILEGRIVERDYAAVLSNKINDRKNARELSNSLQNIIKSWELSIL